MDGVSRPQNMGFLFSLISLVEPHINKNSVDKSSSSGIGIISMNKSGVLSRWRPAVPASRKCMFLYLIHIPLRFGGGSSRRLNQWMNGLPPQVGALTLVMFNLSKETWKYINILCHFSTFEMMQVVKILPIGRQDPIRRKDRWVSARLQ